MPAPVLFQPAAALRFQRGVDTIVGALRPTLGPRPRLVAIDTGISGKQPELLDSGALIARRMIELPDRAAVSSAALALTIDAHVHTRRAASALSPEG